MLIAFEGIDGVGKTTIIDAVSRTMQSFGINNIVVREPGGTASGEIMRQLIKGEIKKVPKVCDFAEVHLLIAAHLEMMDKVVHPAIKAGKVVLTDRTTALSMRAYQVGGKGLDETWINNVLEGTTVPEIVVWLDMPVKMAIARNTKAVNKRDDYDKAGEAFHSRVRAQYLKMATSGRFGHWLRIDANQTPTVVTQKIVNTLVDVLIDRGVIE